MSGEASGALDQRTLGQATLGDLLRRALERGGAALESTAGERLDPAEALAAAARVARLLEEGGVRPDEPVLVAIGNRPADLAALLGIWRAGAVAVPVHVSAAPATLAALLAEAGQDADRTLRLGAEPRWADIPVVMMSAVPEALLRAEFDGYAAFLRKPFDIAGLLEAVAGALAADPMA